ncbi:mechanosensitive ion channel family protein [Fuchsiella alkaliacetigena]|uniref:mechanosensitive ion channel family protein n=1 Tax=Fuchsiella alkaliacetigena TaxID=957042 RepID=UPI002009DECE|nr:mechanosensitive ion channel family protein [Fuchsiella alkaliacetigena]MCK8823796.1 mechanosensitive ion channel family protein [Fuchsiella alkaliacetigena]
MVDLINVELTQLLVLLETTIFDKDFLIGILLIVVQLLAIIVITKLLRKLAHLLINNLFHEKGDYYTQQKNKTLKVISKSAVKYVIYFIAATMFLEVLGIPTSSILAGAGVVGLAIGFGAQDLVQDIITGFFIIFEEQFVVGDYVEIASLEGIVQEIGLRITTIKSFAGDVHIIPNSHIEEVTNYSAANSRVLVDMPIDYEQDIQEAVEVIQEVSQQLEEEYDVIREGPEVLGVQELADSSVNIRIMAMVKPLEQWKIERIIKRRIKERFDEEDIIIPYKHLVVVNE